MKCADIRYEVLFASQQLEVWRQCRTVGLQECIFLCHPVLTTLATVIFVFFVPLFEDTGGDVVVQTVRRHFDWPVQSDHKRNHVVKPVFLFSAQNTHSCRYILCSAVYNICDPVCEIIHPLAQNCIYTYCFFNLTVVVSFGLVLFRAV